MSPRGIIVNKQVQGKILAKRINVWIEHIKNPKNRDGFLKWVRKNDQKERETKEKGTWGSTEAPACPTQRRTLRKD